MIIFILQWSGLPLVSRVLDIMQHNLGIQSDDRATYKVSFLPIPSSSYTGLSIVRIIN